LADTPDTPVFSAKMLIVEIAPRSRRDRNVLVLWGGLLALLWLGMLANHGIRFRLFMLTLGLLVVLEVVRPRRPTTTGGVASWRSSQQLPTGKWWGQLSVTTSEIIWTPDARAVKHGIEEVVIPAAESTSVSLQRTDDLLSMVVKVRSPDGVDRRFRTRRNQRLVAALDALDLAVVPTDRRP
jgi:hypothetical protein